MSEADDLAARRAAPRVRRQLLRDGLRLLGRAAAPEGEPRHVPARQLGARLPRHPAPGGVLRVEGGGPDVPRVGARRAAEARRRRSTSRVVLPGAINTPQFDRSRQRIGFQPQPVPPIYQPEPFAEAVLHCCEHPMRELPRRLGRAEAPLGPEALAARRRPACCGAWAGRGSTRASRSRSTRPTTSSRRCPAIPGAHGRFDDQARGVDALDVAAPAALARRRQPRPSAAGAASLGSWRALARLGHETRPETRFARPDSLSHMALLEIKNLHVALEDGTEIVKGVDLAVDQNEIHAIMGPNGSGKSTLAYALMGHPAYEITEGEILFDGEDLVRAGRRRARAARPLPRVPVPARDPGRDGDELPPQRDQRDPQGARGAGRPDPDPASSARSSSRRWTA